MRSNLLEKFAVTKALIETPNDEPLKFVSGNPELDKNIDENIATELSNFYDDLESSSLIQTHIPHSFEVTLSIGFSSLVKWSHIILSNEAPIGKVVLTAKRNQSVKIGPMYIFPEHRRGGYATQALRLLLSRVDKTKVFYKAFATCPEKNLGGRKVLEGGGLIENHQLLAHYNNTDTEIVYTIPLNSLAVPKSTHSIEGSKKSGVSSQLDAYKHLEYWTNQYFFPTDNDWFEWLTQDMHSLKGFKQKPHEVMYIPSQQCKISALLIYKRNGTMKVVLAHELATQQDMSRLFDRLLDKAQNFRKIAIFLPLSTQTSEVIKWLKFSNFVHETNILSPGYSLYDSIQIYSLIKE